MFIAVHYSKEMEPNLANTSTEGWIMKMQYMIKMECCSMPKKNEILFFRKQTAYSPSWQNTGI